MVYWGKGVLGRAYTGGSVGLIFASFDGIVALERTVGVFGSARHGVCFQLSCVGEIKVELV